MTTNQNVAAVGSAVAKKAKPKRELQDFKTHTVLQSMPEVVFWSVAVAAPVSVFINPLLGVILGGLVAHKISKKNLYMIRVGKDKLTIHKGKLGFSFSAALKDVESVECHLSVRGEGIDEGCVEGEGTVIFRFKGGKVHTFEKVLRAEALCDVVIRRRDFVPMPRNVRPAR